MLLEILKRRQRIIRLSYLLRISEFKSKNSPEGISAAKEPK